MFESYTFHATVRIKCHTRYAQQGMVTSSFHQLARRHFGPSVLRFASSKSGKYQSGQGKRRFKETTVLQQQQVQAVWNPVNQALLQSAEKVPSNADKVDKAHKHRANPTRWYDSKPIGLLGKRAASDKVVAKELAQTLESIESQVQELVLQSQSPSCHLGTASSDRRPVSWVYDRWILEERLKAILRVLIEQVPKIESWEQFLGERTLDDWVPKILALSPEALKCILAAPKPPNISNLKELGWEKTANWGIFGNIVELEPGIPSICISSATTEDWGLLGRQRDLSLGQNLRELKPPIQKHGHGTDRHFFTLLSFQAESLSDCDIVKSRYLIILTKLVLAIWLSAFDETANPLLRSLCPWDSRKISYRGLCKRNPLEEDINLPPSHTNSSVDYSRHLWR